MAIPELTKKVAETKLAGLCERRVPASFRDQVRLEFSTEGHAITLVERRPRFNKPTEWVAIPIARLRFNARANLWTLYCSDRHGKWHQFDLAKPARDVARLVDEIDRDVTGIFFG